MLTGFFRAGKKDRICDSGATWTPSVGAESMTTPADQAAGQEQLGDGAAERVTDDERRGIERLDDVGQVVAAWAVSSASTWNWPISAVLRPRVPNGTRAMTVHLAVTTSQARERLLAAAVEQAMRGGIADLSVRELAAAIGTSHRHALYHSGSREGRHRGRRGCPGSPARGRSAGGDHRRQRPAAREHFGDPQLWPAERPFFELSPTRCSDARAPKDSWRTRPSRCVTAITPAIAREAGRETRPREPKPDSPSRTRRRTAARSAATGDRATVDPKSCHISGR